MDFWIAIIILSTIIFLVLALFLSTINWRRLKCKGQWCHNWKFLQERNGYCMVNAHNQDGEYLVQCLRCGCRRTATYSDYKH